MSWIERTALLARRVLPPSARDFAARAGRFFGSEDRYAFPGLLASLRMIGEWGYRPRFVVDAGAFQGDWTDTFREVFPEANVLMVEPQQSKRPVLGARTDRKTRFADRLLGAEDGRAVTFFEMATGSSVMGELSKVPRTAMTKTLTTLDTLVAEIAPDWGSPDFIKLDVQGYEIEVLNGATNALRSCEFVLLEASILPYNEGAPLLPEVLGYMSERGFRPFDFCAQSRHANGILLQTDVMFVRADSPFAPSNPS